MPARMRSNCWRSRASISCRTPLTPPRAPRPPSPDRPECDCPSPSSPLTNPGIISPSACAISILHCHRARRQALRLAAVAGGPYNRAMLFVLPFPVIDPVLVAIGPFAIRWYALAYVVGILIGWRYARGLAAPRREPADAGRCWMISSPGRCSASCSADASATSSSTTSPNTIAASPARSSPSGMAACRSMAASSASSSPWRCSPGARHLRFFHLTDPVAAATPIGLFLGRLANFINGELYRPRRPMCPGPWSSPMTAPNCRAIRASSTRPGWKGILLFIVLFIAAWRFQVLRRPGLDERRFSWWAMRSAASSSNSCASRISQLGYPHRRADHGPAAVAAHAGLRHRLHLAGPAGRRDARWPELLAAPHRPDRAHHRRRVHGRGARPSASMAITSAAIPSAAPAISSPRRK